MDCQCAWPQFFNSQFSDIPPAASCGIPATNVGNDALMPDQVKAISFCCLLFKCADKDSLGQKQRIPRDAEKSPGTPGVQPGQA